MNDVKMQPTALACGRLILTAVKVKRFKCNTFFES
jgi:hypothetical protein